MSGLVSAPARQWYETDTQRYGDVTGPDNVLVSGRLANGAVASVHVGAILLAAPGPAWKIYGREGTLVVSSDNTPQFKVVRLQGTPAGDSGLQELDVRGEPRGEYCEKRQPCGTTWYVAASHRAPARSLFHAARYTMKENAMRLNLKVVAACVVLALVLSASAAAGAEPTAAQVRDGDTLKAFVEGAKAHIEAITDMNEGAKLREKLRTEGDWKAGSMFLVIFLKSGEPFIHGNDRTAESKNLLGVEDERGTKVVEELFAAAARGGGFVEYYDGGPKTAYAVEYTSGITARRFVLVGGYSQDVSDVPVQIADLPKPAVVASQVVDRETLITFVEEAAKAYREAVMSEGYRGLTGVRNAFRVEGGDWKSGSIYLWVVSGGGVTLFHGSEPYREGKPTDMVRTDSKGVKIAEELIGGARREGRKFLRYHYDNPAIKGDEDAGSPKLGYAVSFSVPNTDQRAVIGSGIYLATDGK